MSKEIIINCENYEESINSLCNIYGQTEEVIIAELQSIDMAKLLGNAAPDEEIYFYICGKFKVKPNQTYKTNWFHFSKSLNINSFYDKGLLPMDQALPILRDNCYNLVKDKYNKKEWDNIWEIAQTELDRKDKAKFEMSTPDFGPHAMLVKEVGLYPVASGIGSFFERPEIVEGILRQIDKKHQTNVWDRFEVQGQSCVVTFIADTDDVDYEIGSIVYYVYNKVNGEKLTSACSANYCAKKLDILPKNIIKVEAISFDSNGTAILCPIQR